MESGKMKNYGKSLLEMTGSVPSEVIKEVSDLTAKILSQFLNSENMERFRTLLPTKKDQISEQDMSCVNKNGLVSKGFILQQIEWAASFSIVSEMMSEEMAIKIFRKIAETTYPKLFSAVFPTPGEIRESEDPFNSFKSWFSAMMDANRKAGLFEYEIFEDSQDVLQINCIWCAWHEIYKNSGLKKACIPVCHADDTFYPDYLRQTGIRYKRTKTIGWGNECCDFRFERKKL